MPEPYQKDFAKILKLAQEIITAAQPIVDEDEGTPAEILQDLLWDISHDAKQIIKLTGFNDYHCV